MTFYNFNAAFYHFLSSNPLDLKHEEKVVVRSLQAFSGIGLDSQGTNLDQNSM